MFRKKNTEPAIYQDNMAQRNGSPVEDIPEDAIPNDPVNHPSHYTDGIEVIDYIEDQKFPYHLGNAVKYLSRAGKKDPTKTVEDLEKAVWYINRYIGLIEENNSAEGTV